MDQKNLTLINVCGTSRSGSTLVHLILGNAPNAFACGEAVSWFRPEHTHHFEINCPCGSQPCPIWAQLSNTSASQFHATAFQKLGVQYIVDSSKTLSWVLDSHRWAKSSRFSVSDVVVWKNPIDLAYSYWKRGHDLNYWRSQFVKYYGRIQQLNLPVIAINIGDLMQSPRELTASLCNAVGMPDYDGKERFWERENHQLFGCFGVRRQVETGWSAFVAEKAYPEEFASKVDALQATIGADHEVQELIHFLRDADVSRVGVDLQQKPYRSPHVYPAWYFAQRIKRVYRRFSPKTPNHGGGREELETIPKPSQH